MVKYVCALLGALFFGTALAWTDEDFMPTVSDQEAELICNFFNISAEFVNAPKDNALRKKMTAAEKAWIAYREAEEKALPKDFTKARNARFTEIIHKRTPSPQEIYLTSRYAHRCPPSRAAGMTDQALVLALSRDDWCFRVPQALVFPYDPNVIQELEVLRQRNPYFLEIVARSWDRTKTQTWWPEFPEELKDYALDHRLVSLLQAQPYVQEKDVAAWEERFRAAKGKELICLSLQSVSRRSCVEMTDEQRISVATFGDGWWSRWALRPYPKTGETYVEPSKWLEWLVAHPQFFLVYAYQINPQDDDYLSRGRIMQLSDEDIVNLTRLNPVGFVELADIIKAKGSVELARKIVQSGGYSPWAGDRNSGDRLPYLLKELKEPKPSAPSVRTSRRHQQKQASLPSPEAIAFLRELAKDFESSPQDAYRLALLRGEIDRAELLNQPHPDGMTPLAYAIYCNDYELAKSLLDAGADPSVSFTIQLLPALKEKEMLTPLAYAIFLGRREIYEFLLKAGADPEQAAARGTPYGYAALSIAFQGYDRHSIIRFLSGMKDVSFNRNVLVDASPLISARVPAVGLIGRSIRMENFELIDFNLKGDNGMSVLELLRREHLDYPRELLEYLFKLNK